MRARAKYSRRNFIQITAVATAVAPMTACLGSLSPWRVLSQTEAATLEALCERIIPADADPGAAYAGVVNYIDRQLTGPFRKLRKTYRTGLAAVEATSQARWGKSFATLNPSLQDAFLQSMETGNVKGDKWKNVSPKTFFNLVLNHTMQGFYGDPRHGGNRDRVSWKMLGLPYPQLRGRLPSSSS